MEFLKRDVNLYDWLVHKHRVNALIDEYIELVDSTNKDKGYKLTLLAKTTYPIGFIKEYICVSKI